jgi:hypothetical protein
VDMNLYGDPCGLEPAYGDTRVAFYIAIPVKRLHARGARLRWISAVAVEIYCGRQGREVALADPMDSPGRLSAVFERDHAGEVYAYRGMLVVASAGRRRD